jgi:hypothetical protein
MSENLPTVVMEYIFNLRMKNQKLHHQDESLVYTVITIFIAFIQLFHDRDRLIHE